MKGRETEWSACCIFRDLFGELWQLWSSMVIKEETIRSEKTHG